MNPTHTPLFHALLKLYHYFPLHSPATLFLVNGSWGRFAPKGEKGRWYLDGNRAWALMEVVSPLTFISTILLHTSLSGLSTGTRLATTMYLTHYAIRSIISPLFLAPARAPQHTSVTLAAIFFNLMNGYMVGSWIGGDPVREGVEKEGLFWVGVGGWVAGLAGNVYHDEILHSLRAPSVIFNSLPFLRPRVPSDSRGRTHLKSEGGGGDESHDGDHAQFQGQDHQSAKVKGKEQDGGKTYEIPTGGLFYWVTFPNYLCEWFEWTCYALLTSPYPFLQSPSTSSLLTQARSQHSGPILWIIEQIARLPFPTSTTMLTPPWMFLLALLAAMIPRAINGHRWYEETFGRRWRDSGRKGGRWVCLPGLL